MYLKIYTFISFMFFLSGCAVEYGTSMDKTLANAHNDERFLKTPPLSCPESLKDKTVKLTANFDKCAMPMNIEYTVSNLDYSIRAVKAPYEGSWRDDVLGTIKRNISAVCGTKFSDSDSVPTIEMDFSKLTSQIISIDQTDRMKDANLLKVDHNYDVNHTTNYVAQAKIGGSVFDAPFTYVKGLQKKESFKMKELMDNYLLAINARTETTDSIHVFVLPDNYPLYSESVATVLDMRSVIIPVVKKEVLVNYTLYAENGNVLEKKALSNKNGGLVVNTLPPSTEVVSPSDKAIIGVFGAIDNHIASSANTYIWLLYDISREIIKNAK